jgi:hypothetical protein
MPTFTKNVKVGHLSAVPANGCLARLPPWPHASIADSGCNAPLHPRFEAPLFQAKGDLRLLLTLTYHGCPRILSRILPGRGPSTANAVWIWD